jgi:hypothetical protein
MKSFIFWESQPRFRRCNHLHPQGRKVSHTRNQHKVGSNSETSVYFHHTTQRYFSEDRILHSHHWEGLESDIKETIILHVVLYGGWNWLLVLRAKYSPRVQCEIFTRVKMPTVFFWIMSPYSLDGDYQNFGGTATFIFREKVKIQIIRE